MNTTRTEACALMYLLMRRNFEFAHHKSFTRVHLQVKFHDCCIDSSHAFVTSVSVQFHVAHTHKQQHHDPYEEEEAEKRRKEVMP